MKLYHTTLRKNLDSIKLRGLIPSKFGIVYLSENPDSWWQGEEYVTLEIDMTDSKNKMTTFNDPNLDEILCWGPIEPNRIKEKVNKMKNYTATEMWCRITNALISKYKEMSEENPKGAVEDLLRLEGALIVGGFLTKEELEKGL